jgi:hypothetical protein
MHRSTPQSLHRLPGDLLLRIILYIIDQPETLFAIARTCHSLWHVLIGCCTVCQSRAHWKTETNSDCISFWIWKCMYQQHYLDMDDDDDDVAYDERLWLEETLQRINTRESESVRATSMDRSINWYQVYRQRASLARDWCSGRWKCLQVPHFRRANSKTIQCLSVKRYCIPGRTAPLVGYRLLMLYDGQVWVQESQTVSDIQCLCTHYTSESSINANWRRCLPLRWPSYLGNQFDLRQYSPQALDAHQCKDYIVLIAHAREDMPGNNNVETHVFVWRLKDAALILHSNIEPVGHWTELRGNILLACSSVPGSHSYVWHLARIELQYQEAPHWLEHPPPPAHDSATWLLRSRAQHHFLGMAHLQLRPPAWPGNGTSVQVLLCKHLMTFSTYRWSLIACDQLPRLDRAVATNCCLAPASDLRIIKVCSYDASHFILVVRQNATHQVMFMLFSLIENGFTWSYIIDACHPVQHSLYGNECHIIPFLKYHLVTIIYQDDYIFLDLSVNMTLRQNTLFRLPARLSKHLLGMFAHLSNHEKSSSMQPLFKGVLSENIKNVAYKSAVELQRYGLLDSQSVTIASTLSSIVYATEESVCLVVPESWVDPLVS